MFMMNDIGHLIGSGRPDQQPASLYEVGNKLVKVIQEKTVTLDYRRSILSENPRITPKSNENLIAS